MAKKRKYSEQATPLAETGHEWRWRPIERYPSQETSREASKSNNFTNGNENENGSGDGNTPIDSHRVSMLRTKFDSLQDALLDLLSEPASEAELLIAVGSDDKFTFVQALRSLYQTGDLKWLALDDSGKSKQREESNQREESKQRHESKQSEENMPTTALLSRISSPLSQSRKWPPPLPQINSKAIETQVFTHASFIGGDGNGLGDEQKHYQRLEFLGDAALNFITTNILYHRFPSSREGQLSLIRQEFVSNKNLYTYSLSYNFHNRVRLGKDAIQQEVKWGVKYAADIFEAYIGGIVADRPGLEGLCVVDEFLRELFEPQLVEQVGVARDKLPPTNKQARHELWNLVGGNPAVKLRYEWTGGGGGSEGGFWFTVYLSGYDRYTNLVLGKGYGQSKQDAQLRAAMDALQNTVLLEEIKGTKDEYLSGKKKAPSLPPPPLSALPLSAPPASPFLSPPINSSIQNSNPPGLASSSTSSGPRLKNSQNEVDTSWLWTPNESTFK